MGDSKMYRATHLLCGYRKQDRKNGFDKVIDFDGKWIVENIFTKPCAHCGIEGWNIIGCNRIDNSKPHTKDNVEPCCKHCNISLGAIENNSKQVYQYTLNGELVKVWNSMADACRNGYQSACICKCCKGQLKTHKGFIWSYNPL